MRNRETGFYEQLLAGKSVYLGIVAIIPMIDYL